MRWFASLLLFAVLLLAPAPLLAQGNRYGPFTLTPQNDRIWTGVHVNVGERITVSSTGQYRCTAACSQLQSPPPAQWGPAGFCAGSDTG